MIEKKFTVKADATGHNCHIVNDKGESVWVGDAKALDLIIESGMDYVKGCTYDNIGTALLRIADEVLKDAETIGVIPNAVKIIRKEPSLWDDHGMNTYLIASDLLPEGFHGNKNCYIHKNIETVDGKKVISYTVELV